MANIIKQVNIGTAENPNIHDIAAKYHSDGTELDTKYQAKGNYAPKAHASTATTYGAGTGDNYGHVKLSDSTSSTSAASAGIAASPKAVSSALTAAKTYADNKVAGLVDSSPSTLDTLNELAAALGDDPNFATTVATQIGEKANASDLTAHTGNTNNPHGVTKAQIGLANVEDKSSATIRSEITKANVTTALGTSSSGTKYLKEDGTWATPSNTKNTTGTNEKPDTKLFLAGATAQSSNPTTYSNAKVYIGTDNCLYSNGAKTLVASDLSAGTGLALNGTTFSASLKSTTALTSDASTVTASKIYPVVIDKSKYLAVGLPNHTHSVEHTPAGSINSKTTGITASFTGTAAEHQHDFTGTATKSGAPVYGTTSGDQSTSVLTSVKTNGSVSLSGGSVSLSGGSVSLSGGGVTLSGGAVTATVDADGVLSFGHTNPTASLTLPTASLTRPTASLTLPTVSYTAPTFNTSSVASTAHKHSVTATGTIGNKSITPAGSITITDPGHDHAFTGTKATITSGVQSA